MNIFTKIHKEVVRIGDEYIVPHVTTIENISSIRKEGLHGCRTDPNWDYTTHGDQRDIVIPHHLKKAGFNTESVVYATPSTDRLYRESEHNDSIRIALLKVKNHEAIITDDLDSDPHRFWKNEITLDDFKTHYKYNPDFEHGYTERFTKLSGAPHHLPEEFDKPQVMISSKYLPKKPLGYVRDKSQLNIAVKMLKEKK